MKAMPGSFLSFRSIVGCQSQSLCLSVVSVFFFNVHTSGAHTCTLFFAQVKKYTTLFSTR